MKTNSLSAWILAIRPYSLGNSVILILIGSALAFTDGGFRPVVALLCLVFAVTMQCTANLVNDLCDFLKGADRPDRLGPDRAFAKGYITLRAMKSGIAAFTLAACAAGAGLLALSGWNWWLLLVGASCIVFAYFYTAGPWPLAYHGMGDIAVILFFGLIPVGFTYYLQCGGWSGETAVVGLACGMVIDTMLMINNFRDREEDRRCNKRTIVVCLGAAAGRWGYLVLGTGAILLCLSLLAEGRIAAALLPLPYLAVHIATWRKMVRIDHGEELNVCLGETARNILLFGALRPQASCSTKSCANNGRHLLSPPRPHFAVGIMPDFRNSDDPNPKSNTTTVARQTDGAIPGNRPSPNDRPAGPRFAALAEKRARSAQARTTGDQNERKGRQPTLPGEKTENP